MTLVLINDGKNFVNNILLNNTRRKREKKKANSHNCQSGSFTLRNDPGGSVNTYDLFLTKLCQLEFYIVVGTVTLFACNFWLEKKNTTGKGFGW